jgi:hypothetical protein
VQFCVWVYITVRKYLYPVHLFSLALGYLLSP